MTRIRIVEIENFRSIKQLSWLPNNGINCLVGPGDGGKSTIVDAIDLCLGARQSVAFSDADFHSASPDSPITISITLGDLDDGLKNFDAYGDFLIGFDAAKGEVQPEPGVGLETALTIRLTVSLDLEADWSLISPRAQSLGKARNLIWADRVRIAPGRLGATGDSHLSWRKGSVVSRLTDGTAEAQRELMRAARELRTGFDTSTLSELEAPLRLVLGEAQALGLPVGASVKAMLDAGSVTFNAGTISLHNENGVPLRSLGVGSSRLLIAALQRKLSESTSIFLIDELEYGLEPHRIIRLLGTLGAKEGTPPIQVFATSHSPVVVAELNAAQLCVVRSGVEHSVLRAGDVAAGDTVQKAIRSNPHALLASRIIVCEGASEIGIMRGMDMHFISQGKDSLAKYGATLVNGGGDETFHRANAFLALGYRVAVLRDSDKPAPADLEASFVGGGGSIHAWTNNRSLEQELFAAVPEAQVASLLELAIETKDRNAVAAHIEKYSGAGLTLDDVEAVLELGGATLDIRTCLGDAAAGKGWFKTLSTMELVGSDIVAPVFSECDTSFTDVMTGLWKWIMN